MPHDTKTILTPGQAAELLQLSERTVLRLARGGKLPCRRVGGRWRFSTAELEAYVAGTGNGASPLPGPEAHPAEPPPAIPQELLDAANGDDKMAAFHARREILASVGVGKPPEKKP